MQDFVPFVVVLLVFLSLVLMFSGFIGPGWWRTRMQALNRWYFKDSAQFLPIDPYKPTWEAVKEGIKNFWPTKTRWQEFNRPLLAFWVFTVFLYAIILTALVLFLLLHY